MQIQRLLPHVICLKLCHLAQHSCRHVISVRGLKACASRSAHRPSGRVAGAEISDAAQLTRGSLRPWERTTGRWGVKAVEYEIGRHDVKYERLYPPRRMWQKFACEKAVNHSSHANQLTLLGQEQVELHDNWETGEKPLQRSDTHDAPLTSPPAREWLICLASWTYSFTMRPGLSRTSSS